MPKNPLNFNQSINFQTLHLLRKIHRRRQRDPLLISEEIKSRWCHKWKNSKKTAWQRGEEKKMSSQTKADSSVSSNINHFSFHYFIISAYTLLLTHFISSSNIIIPICRSWHHDRMWGEEKKRCSCMRKRKATASTMAEKKSLTCIGDGSEQASKQKKWKLLIMILKLKLKVFLFSLLLVASPPRPLRRVYVRGYRVQRGPTKRNAKPIITKIKCEEKKW